MIYFENEHIKLYQADVLECLPTFQDEFIQCVVTSPPYWSLRDYGIDGQIGLEKTPEEYIDKMVTIFREVRRVLKKDGTLWLNLGDTYSSGSGGDNGNPRRGSTLQGGRPECLKRKPNKYIPTKNLIGIPWRVALALQADGWYLRSDIIWSKPNGMPESVTDRPTRAHEYIFLFTKASSYFYDHAAIREPFKDIKRFQQDIENQKGSSKAHGGNKNNGNMKARGNIAIGANKRTVWEIPVGQFKDAHFAVFPPKLIEPCILAGSRHGDVVLDPFWGSGTSGEVCINHHRKAIGIELSSEYCKLSLKRFKQGSFNF